MGPALGQPLSISPDAAALVGYVSPYQSRPADGILEEDPELSRLRETAQADEEVGRLTAWTTRKDYNTLVGIALPSRMGWERIIMLFSSGRRFLIQS
jgi:hypothetical protein